jgi:thioester reductase-like protein/pimeloyl-ACP methyl ester carboxylesterase
MKTLLVTGSTGFIGSHFVLDRLINTDDNILCISRDSYKEKSHQRVLNSVTTAAKNSGIEDTSQIESMFENRVQIINGNLTKPLLGCEQNIGMLSADEVWHFAAMLKFTDKLKKHLYRTNLEGTKELIKVTKLSGAKTLNYISTAYVAGKTKQSLLEKVNRDIDHKFNNTYEETKSECEKLVSNLANTQGINYRIFRPSMVIAHSKTGIGATDTGYYGLLTICGRLQNEIESKIPNYLSKHPITLLTKNANSRLNLICVDDVINQLDVISRSEDSKNMVFHITNEDQIKFNTLIETLSATLNIKILLSDDPKKLSPLDHLVRKQIGDFEEYFSTEYLFDQTNTKMFAGSNYTKRDISKIIQKFSDTYYKHFNENDTRSSIHTSVISQMEKCYVETPNGNLNYYKGGNGKTNLIIINAYGQSLHFWNDVIRRLGHMYSIYVWEIRGTSVTDGGMSSFYTTPDHILDARAIIDKEKLESFHTIGWCTGPKLSIELATIYKEQLKSLIFLTPAFKGVSQFKGDTQYEKNMQPLCSLVDRRPEAASSLMQSMSAYFADKSEDLDDFDVTEMDAHEGIKNVLGLVDRNLRPLLMAPFVSEKSIVNYSRQLLQFWSHDISQYINKIEQPILLLTGSHDHIASPDLAVAVTKQFKTSIGYEISGGSHYIHKEHEKLVSDMITGFIEEGKDYFCTDDRVEQTIA